MHIKVGKLDLKIIEEVQYNIFVAIVNLPSMIVQFSFLMTVAFPIHTLVYKYI